MGQSLHAMHARAEAWHALHGCATAPQRSFNNFAIREPMRRMHTQETKAELSLDRLQLESLHKVRAEPTVPHCLAGSAEPCHPCSPHSWAQGFWYLSPLLLTLSLLLPPAGALQPQPGFAWLAGVRRAGRHRAGTLPGRAGLQRGTPAAPRVPPFPLRG